MLGLSTAWLTEKPKLTGHHIIKEIVSLSFEAVELDYRITEAMFTEMAPLLVEEKLKVLSIHNFFPLPKGTPRSGAGANELLLSTPYHEERARAVEQTVRTIETAEKLGALAVVLHLGRVEMDPEYGRLSDLFQHNEQNSPEGQRFRKRKLKERREKRGRYLENVLRSLDRLSREADKRGVLLGIENRYYYQEIPDFEEIGQILARFSGGPVSYWHDVGHAHVQERLGFTEPGALLRSYGSMLAGIHIHDALGTDDHRAPGTGEIDFLALTGSLRSARIKILEVHKKSSRQDLLKGRHMLESIGLV